MSIGSSTNAGSVQNIISTYIEPNQVDRLNRRSADIKRGDATFSLTRQEFTNTYNKDSQNQWAESWYGEYKVVLQMRADAMQKKLNMEYNRVLDNSVFAPMHSEDENGDQNIDSVRTDFSPDSNQVLGLPAGPITGSGGTSSSATDLPLKDLLLLKLKNNYTETLWHPMVGGSGYTDRDSFDSAIIPTAGAWYNPKYYTTWQEGNAGELVTKAAFNGGVSTVGGVSGALLPGWTAYLCDSNNTANAGGNYVRVHKPDTIAGTVANPNYLSWSKTHNPNDPAATWHDPSEPDSNLTASNLTGYYEGSYGVTYTNADAAYTAADSNFGAWEGKSPYWIYRQQQIDAIIAAALDASGAYYTVSGASDFSNSDIADLVIFQALGGTVQAPDPGNPGTAVPTIMSGLIGANGVIKDIENLVADPMTYGILDFRTDDGDGNVSKPNFVFDAAGGYINLTDSSSPKPTDVSQNGEHVSLYNANGTKYYQPIEEDIYNNIFANLASKLAFSQVDGMPAQTLPALGPNGNLQSMLGQALAPFGLGDYVTDSLVGDIYDNLLAGSTSIRQSNTDLDFLGREWDSATLLSDMFVGKSASSCCQILPCVGPTSSWTVYTNTAGMVLPSVGLTKDMSGYVTPMCNSVSGQPNGLLTTPLVVASSAIKPSGAGVLPNLLMFAGWYSIPITITGVTVTTTMANYTTFDFFTWMMDSFMNAIKGVVMTTAEVNSYATSGGTAMDSYASRGEYHFYQRGITEVFKAFAAGMPTPLDSLIGDAFNSVGAAIIGDLGEVDGVDVEDRLMNVNHSVQAAESRETETGGLFATTEFLRQFNVQSMDYTYWTKTVQNEETINADMLKGVSTAGDVILKKMVGLMLSALPEPWKTPIGTIAQLLLPMLTKTLFSDYIYKPQSSTGDALMFGLKSSWESKGFDFLEPEDGMTGDARENNAKAAGNWMGDLGIPNQIIDGTSNSRRFIDGTSGVTTWSGDWSQGDINEVLVYSKGVHVDDMWNGSGTKVVVENPNSLMDMVGGGLDSAGNPIPDRYIGSDSRIYERKYNANKALNQEVFNTNFLTGGVDRTHVDRKDLYNLSFTTSTGQTVTRTRDASLNPSFGGGFKMATIDKNKRDDVLLGSAPTHDSLAEKEYQYFGGAQPNKLISTLYEHMHLKSDMSNLQTVKQYRDVFNMGFCKHIYLTGASYATTGGGINSSIELRYKKSDGASLSIDALDTTGMYDSVDSTDTGYGIYDTATAADAQYLNTYQRFFKNADKGSFDLLMNSYLAYKKRNADTKT